MEIIDVTGMEPGEILWQRQFVMAPDHFTQVCALVTTAKGPSENKVCILARAPGGQMQGAATQAMWWHRRGAATPQMPARRRAPPGCGPQARWLCCSVLTYRSGYARRSRLASGPGGQQQNAHLISLRALSAFA